MKFFVLYSYLCVVIVAQENSEVSMESELSDFQSSSLFADQLIRSLFLATADATTNNALNIKDQTMHLTTKSADASPNLDLKKDPVAVLFENNSASPVTLMELLTNNVSSIAASISKTMTQNIVLSEKQREDLKLIETLLKRQQEVLDHLALLGKMNLEKTASSVFGTEPVMTKVVESMSTYTTALSNLVITTPMPSKTTTNIKNNRSKAKPAIITEKQIELLISQLEAIQKNPEKVKKLDIGALRRLQKFENSVQTADDATILQMVKMDVKTDRDTNSLSNRLGNVAEISIAVSRTTPSTTTVPTTVTTTSPITIHRATNDVSVMDPKMRKELVLYALSISKAISSFLGSALQEATQKFATSLVNSNDPLNFVGLGGTEKYTMS